MALNPTRPRLRNISNGLAKFSLSVEPGDEIEVSEALAAQIESQRVPMVVAAPAPEAEPEVEGEAEPEKPEKPKATRKRAAKKAD